jgi:hypothetical protein
MTFPRLRRVIVLQQERIENAERRDPDAAKRRSPGRPPGRRRYDAEME